MSVQIKAATRLRAGSVLEVFEERLRKLGFVSSPMGGFKSGILVDAYKRAPKLRKLGLAGGVELHLDTKASTYVLVHTLGKGSEGPAVRTAPRPGTALPGFVALIEVAVKDFV